MRMAILSQKCCNTLRRISYMPLSAGSSSDAVWICAGVKRDAGGRCKVWVPSGAGTGKPSNKGKRQADGHTWVDQKKLGKWGSRSRWEVFPPVYVSHSVPPTRVELIGESAGGRLEVPEHQQVTFIFCSCSPLVVSLHSPVVVTLNTVVLLMMLIIAYSFLISSQLFRCL